MPETVLIQDMIYIIHLSQVSELSSDKQHYRKTKKPIFISMT